MAGSRVDGRTSGQILLTSIGLGCSIGAALGAAISICAGLMVGSAAAGIGLVGFGLMLGGIPGCVLGLVNGTALVITAERTRSKAIVRLVAGVTTAACVVGVAALVDGLRTEGAAFAVIGLGAIAVIVAPRAAFGPRRRPWPPNPVWLIAGLGPFAGFGAVLGLAVGAVVGLVIGLVSYLPTAAFAAVEGGLLGLGPGAIVGVLARMALLAARSARRGAA